MEGSKKLRMICSDMAPLYDLPYIVDRLDEFFKLPSNDLRARPLGFFSLNHGLERDHHGRRNWKRTKLTKEKGMG